MTEFTTKYRPQKIVELDLMAVREGLEKVLRSGKVPHAFLFAGPRGIGKTSAARIIAKAVNCESRAKEDFEPCNSCDQCLSITAGTNIDVLEIDAASNRGIDDIRELREKIRLAPAKAEFKVYIIDEVHMLTTEAFNALLKTLEEPPKHAIFILCTTAPEKLPETIISRCLRFNFKRPTIKEIVTKLKRIAEEEKLKVEEKALLEIARAVNGSFRDANKILEQASFAGDEITPESVKEILGQALGFEPKKLIGYLKRRETKEAISEINRLIESGANLRFYLEQILEELRALLLRQYGIEIDGQELASEEFSIGEIETLIRLFSQAGVELREAIIPQLPLEMAVVEWGERGKTVLPLPHSISDSASPPVGGKPALGPDARPLSGFDSGALEPASDRRNPRSATASTNLKIEEIQSRWQEVLLAVRPKNHSVEALLRATRPKAINGEMLTIEVFYKFHKDKLETEKCRQIVEEAASEIFDCLMKIKFLLGEKPIIAKTLNEPKHEDFPPSQFSNEHQGPAASAVPGNGETTDQDIIEVAREIFSGTLE